MSAASVQNGTPACSCRPADKLDERMLRRRFERLAAHAEPQHRITGNLAQLALDLLDCLAGDRPPLAREETACGVARELLTALDQ